MSFPRRPEHAPFGLRSWIRPRRHSVWLPGEDYYLIDRVLPLGSPRLEQPLFICMTRRNPEEYELTEILEPLASEKGEEEVEVTYPRVPHVIDEFQKRESGRCEYASRRMRSQP
jgi:hypothetical protein